MYVNIEITDYKIEGFEFQFIEDNDAILNFTVGLYTSTGKKFTSVTFSNKSLGIPFKPNNSMNSAIHEVLAALDEWFGSQFIPELMSDET